MCRVRSGLAFLFLSCLPGVANADATSEAKSQLTALYLKEAKAGANKDANAILSDYSADFVATDRKGKKKTVAELRKEIPQMLQMLSNIVDKPTITKISLKGNVATVSLTEVVTAEVSPPPGSAPAR